MDDNARGLYNKYLLAHADGTPIDSEAQYFVLRYDGQSAHAEASRQALRAYAVAIMPTNRELGRDILASVNSAS